MTFGEKLSKLRKENNYTQEQLAEILKVSRQSVSKWESDIVYPETDKLIEIGNLFHCSMDYLLKQHITEKNPESTIKKATTNENSKKLKRILIVVSVIFAVVYMVTIAVFLHYSSSNTGISNESGNSRCLTINCENSTVNGGLHCEEHTCVKEGCTNERTHGQYCEQHSLTFAKSCTPHKTPERTSCVFCFSVPISYDYLNFFGLTLTFFSNPSRIKAKEAASC